MTNLLKLSFWFDLAPHRLSSQFEIALFVVFAAVILAGLIFRMVAKTKTDKFQKILLRRVATVSLVMGFAGLVWLFFATEEIQLFGSKFWLLIWVIIWIVYKISWFRYWRKTVPQLRLLEQSKAEANKYLPRKR